MRYLMILLLLSCGPAPGRTNQDAAQGGDGGNTENSPVPVRCETYVHETTLSNGARSVVTAFLAVVPEISAGDDFMISYCAPSSPDTCSGVSCTGSRGPSGRVCVNTRDGTFVDGSLLVECGRITESFDANGNSTFRIESPREDLRVERR
jgi:hypothetical protein